VDFETVVAPGYDLQRLGVRRYVEDPRCDILSASVAVGSGRTRFFWLGAPRAVDDLPAAYSLLEQQLEAGRQLVAHNVLFEGLILEKRLGLRFERVFDTAAYGRYLGIGASLKNMARRFGYEKVEAPPFEEKSLRDPVLLGRMAIYNMADVALCREVYRHACEDTALPDFEFDIIDHTAHLNLRGVCIGGPQVEALLETLQLRRDRELEAFARKYPFDTTHVNKGKRVLAFIREHFGVSMNTLDRKKEDFVDAVLGGGDLAEFLLSRARLQALSKGVTRATAYATIDGGRVHGVVKYGGAHTGRFSAGGRDAEKVNLHGLGKGNELLGLPELGLERTVVVPEEGFLLRACDLSTIEARVVAWLAREQDLLERFRRGDDVYSWFAGLVYPGVLIKKGGANAHLRALGKESVLGLGFGMGLPTFQRQVRAKQLGCNQRDVERAFETYRSSFPRIRELRRALFVAFEKAAKGWAGEHTLCTFRCIDDGPAAPTVCVELPTGRTLFYRSVHVEPEWTEYGMRPTLWFAPSFGGKGKSAPASSRQKQRRFADGVIRHRLTPQVVVENIVQAVARDVMVHQALELERRGLRVAWHAHDEIVVLCERCPCTAGCGASCAWTKAGDTLLEVMGHVPRTLPRLADLPLGCELNDRVRATYSA
jgi:DNA polymerase bacteriophage-type